MSQPKITNTELRNALGIVPPSSGAPPAFVGPADGGPLNTPASYSRVPDLQAAFVGGRLVQDAATYLDQFGGPVVVCRSAATTAASAGALVKTFVGSSVPTVHAAPAPDDDYEAYWICTTGGTVGTAGILFQWSLDGGRTLSPITALGTALLFVFPGPGTLQIDFAAGTIVAGDVLMVPTTGPVFNAADLGAALDALAATTTQWDGVIVAGALVAATFDTLDAKLLSMKAAGDPHWGIAHARMPTPGETVTAYKTALDAIFAGKSTVWFALTAGATKTRSGVDGRIYRRPPSLAVGAYESNAKAHINIAAIEEGPLGGVAIRDANGNPDEYDETINGVLDDARYYVLRTWKRRPGVFVNRPRIFSGPTDDIQLVPHRRVLNIFEKVVNSYLETRLSKGLQANAKTGFILEAEAREVEKGVVKAARGALGAEPMVSGISFTLNRDDPLTGESLPVVHGSGRIVGLIYPDRFDITTGFAQTAVVNG